MNTRRPTVVAPSLQIAAYAQTPVHTDPTVQLSGVTLQPVTDRVTLWIQPSPWPGFRPSVLVHPTISIAPPSLIGDQTGAQIEIAHQVQGNEGMPASAWRLRRNFRARPTVEPGEVEV